MCESTVSLVHGKRFFSGDATLNISREQKALRVAITTDQAKYEPGQQATFTVSTSAPDGTPVQSELSLGLVDEAIYAIQPDDTENIVSAFYPRRSAFAATAFSFPEIYLSGDDKAGSTIQTRRYFPDTAFWNPRRGDRRKRQGQRDGDHARFPHHLARHLPRGHAGYARGAGHRHGIGAEAFPGPPGNPALPHPQGDEATLAVIAHNLTEQPLSVKLGLTATGAELHGNSDGATTSCPGTTQRVEWRVDATTVGTASFRAWGIADPVSGKRLTDALALSLPVEEKGRLRCDARRRQRGRRTQTFTWIMRGAHRGHGTPDHSPDALLRLCHARFAGLSGTISVWLYRANDVLLPAGCGGVAIAHAIGGAQYDDLQQRVPKMVNAGLLKLYGYQHRGRRLGLVDE